MLLLSIFEGRFRGRALYGTQSDQQQFKNVNKVVLNRSIVVMKLLTGFKLSMKSIFFLLLHFAFFVVFAHIHLAKV